ncbi:Predicted transcriptional regulator, contains HTH domain [Halogranum rubrum]|uniref:Predicted transcriptional regulator, contains HTH domain n=1 Tax=Halogranum rubrum TaxID=553466 RepID=A0A1I4C427_9EURY|nr:hypothetical protein [Halogranum rubrum]SFK75380.1 Predicted transcriptional regulator, contains HTH domain [Halogranum rubrum]
MSDKNTDMDREAIRVVTQRVDFLELLTTSPLSKREVIDELPYSRSTVDRAIRDLQIAGLIDKEERGYVVTLSGRVSAEQYQNFVETALDTIAAQDVADTIPADVPLDGRLFRGSTVHRSDDVAPYELVDHLVESLDGATHLRTLSEAIPHPRYFEAVVDRCRRGSLTVDGVLTSSLWEALVDHHPETLEQIFDVGMDISVGDVPAFTLHLIDRDDGTTVQVLIHTDTGSIRGILTNESTEALEWGNDLFARVSEEADAVDGSSLDDAVTGEADEE